MTKIRIMAMLIITATLAACIRHHAPVGKPVAPPIVRPTWLAQKINPDKFSVVVLDGKAEKEATDELCPTREYVCTKEPVRTFILQRKRK
jgi:hypothetical protein